MFRRWMTLLLLLCPLAAQADAETYVRLAGHMVKVMAAAADGRINTGSGVQLAPDLVATNCHVAGNGGHVIASRGSFGREALQVFGDGARDVCLLHLPGDLATPVEPAPLPEIDEPVYAMGFSGGQVLSLSEGRVVALRESESGLVIETDAAFHMGASGGGLFDARGRLLGLLTFYSPEPDAHYFAVPTRWVLEVAQTMAAGNASADTGQAPFWTALDATTLHQGGHLLPAGRKPRGTP
ncbi:MAG: trypsin-like peptidase domain-containing protein [Rhodocyclaceae bacterium]|nr:trypsin-like peptidase domain-containing protein [Rhodocyclaceae bacterium]